MLPRDNASMWHVGHKSCDCRRLWRQGREKWFNKKEEVHEPNRPHLVYCNQPPSLLRFTSSSALSVSLSPILSAYIICILRLAVPPLSFDDWRRSKTERSCLTGRAQSTPASPPRPPRQTFDSASACRVFSVKVVWRETHSPNPWSIMGGISVQIAAKSRRDGD